MLQSLRYNNKILILTKNKKINNRYFIKQELESGISLLGWEVKLIRTNKININNSYVVIKNNEAYLNNINFSNKIKFPFFNINDKKKYKLLLHKSEINYLSKYMYLKKYTIIVISVYLKNSWVKLKLGVVINKTKYDKKMIIKKKEWQINKNRILKQNKI